MNPAVTLAFAVVKRLPWRKVPVYWAAQLLGAFVASVCVYGVYYGMYENYDQSNFLSWLAYLILCSLHCRQRKGEGEVKPRVCWSGESARRDERAGKGSKQWLCCRHIFSLPSRSPRFTWASENPLLSQRLPCRVISL